MVKKDNSYLISNIMKNSFKYIAALVAFSAAALVTGITASAQNLEGGTYEVNNGIAFVKSSTINNDGTYTVDLETFVTGEVTQTYESVPVDVVLVLDVSGSMDDVIDTVSGYNEANVSSITGSGLGAYTNLSASTGYYFKYNDSYYEVYKGKSSGAGILVTAYYYLYFTVQGTTYYINTSGQVVTNRPSNVTSENTNLLASNVQLYTPYTTTITKMSAMKDAVKAFIAEIKKNDEQEDDGTPRNQALGNSIAIVKFASASYYTNANQYEESQGGNHRFNQDGYSYNYTEVVRKMTRVETGVSDLIDAIDELVEGGATAADYGMQLALNIINHIDSGRNSNKVVVFFTDGSPTHASDFDNTVANTAIANSKSIKDITYGSGDDATHPIIYSVGLFNPKPSATDNIAIFMERVSSDFPNATGMGNNAGGTQASTSYYLDASGGSAEDLKDIFTAIAHASGGSGNVEVTGTSTLTVDIVSTSFSVPKGYENNPGAAVTVLVAPCNGTTTINNQEYLTFGTAKDPSEYGLPAITPTISEADNKVSTSGFDYSANWCGPDPTSTSQIHNYRYHGFKQIIRFVITVTDSAVGGPAVETNAPGSGIYLPGATEPLIEFNRPTVKVPVNIWIQKIGLVGEDSAVFTLYTTPLPDDFNPDTFDPSAQSVVWTNFTKVVVNKDVMDENGMVKITGLDPDFFYKIKEDAWAFGYTYQSGGVLYTVGDNATNPFVFTNTPNPVKFDEATVRNVFKEKTQE